MADLDGYSLAHPKPPRDPETGGSGVFDEPEVLAAEDVTEEAPGVTAEVVIEDGMAFVVVTIPLSGVVNLDPDVAPLPPVGAPGGAPPPSEH